MQRCLWALFFCASRVCEAYLLSFIASAQRQEQLKDYNLVRSVYRTRFWRSMLSLLSRRMKTYAYSASFFRCNRRKPWTEITMKGYPPPLFPHRTGFTSSASAFISSRTSGCAYGLSKSAIHLLLFVPFTFKFIRLSGLFSAFAGWIIWE